MHIAVVTTSFPSHPDDPSGHFVRTEALELRQKHRVSIFAPSPSRGKRDESDLDVYDLPHFGAMGWPGMADILFRRPWRSCGLFPFSYVLFRKLQVLKPELIISHWAIPSGLVCAYLRHFFDIKNTELRLVSHGSDVRFLLRLPSLVRHRLVGTLVSNACEWRFVSQALAKSLIATLDKQTTRALEKMICIRAAALALPIDRSLCFRPGVGGSGRGPNDIPFRPASYTSSGLGANSRLISVGRLVPCKRVDRILEYVAKQAPESTLIVVGDGPSRPSLERQAKRLGVRAEFKGLLGRRETLTYLSAAHMLLMASEAEGLSTVVREAEALGTEVKWV